MSAPSPAPSPATRRLAALPRFALYGEPGAPASELLHIEPIHSRSRLYDWEIDAHVHQGLHQVLWLRAGPVTAMLDEDRTATEGPAFVVIPPGVAHAFRFSQASDGFVLTFDAARLAEGDAATGDALQCLFDAPHLLSLPPGAPDAARVQPLFEALLAEHGDGDGAPGPVPRWLARAAIWRLARIDQRERRPESRRSGAGRRALYTRWVALVEANYLAHWPVSRYAERLGLSAESLNRMVRAETGRTAQEVLHERLAREACRRLVHVVAPISRLAFELGFEDPAYFCRFFKRRLGVPPRAYRQGFGMSAPAGRAKESP